tara:strand:- start:41 stop:418 length:378 start_codon:yes stop_codon:yes gene_type:complete
MKSRLEKVYNKLPNQKVDLKAQEIALSKVQELKSLISETDDFLDEFISEYDKALSIIESIENKLSNLFDDFEQSRMDSFEKLDEIEIAADNLGLQGVGEEDAYELGQIIGRANDQFNLARQHFNF